MSEREGGWNGRDQRDRKRTEKEVLQWLSVTLWETGPLGKEEEAELRGRDAAGTHSSDAWKKKSSNKC